MLKETSDIERSDHKEINDGLDGGSEADCREDKQYANKESDAVESSKKDIKGHSGSKRFSMNKVIGGVLVGAGLLSAKGSIVNANRNIDKELLNERTSVSTSLSMGENIIDKNKKETSKNSIILNSDIKPTTVRADVGEGQIFLKQRVGEENKIEEKGSVKARSERIGEILNEEVKEILSLQPELLFDSKGALFFKDYEGKEETVLMIETDRHLNYPYERLQDVKFFVIHYDGAPQTFISGIYRTVKGTINGLNREGNPSVHFCVDSYPVTNEVIEEKGLGIILSQQVDTIPYCGRHITIGVELETGREDINRIKTAKLYEELDIGAGFVDFVNGGNKDFDAYSLGVEQVGTSYSKNFPHNFPPKQQIANMLALSEAVVKRYNLKVWDIVGHHEIQEKSDPGDEYMLTLRYLLGVSYAISAEGFEADFLETNELYEYFSNLKRYSITRMGEERYNQWNEIYGLDLILGSLERQEMVVLE